MPLRVTAPKLSSEKYEENFAGITPPMNARQAAIEAARIIFEANILGESCGRVCPTEVLCEGACVMSWSRKARRRLRLAGCSSSL